MIRTGANDPLLLERVRDSFSRQSFMGLIGAEVITVSHGKVVLDLPFRADLFQQNGFLHGGGVGAFAAVAGGYGASPAFGVGTEFLRANNKPIFTPPAGGSVKAAVRERGGQD